MGDLANDAWDTVFNETMDRLTIERSLREMCDRPRIKDCDADEVELNDDGLWECPACGRTVDL